MHRFRSARVRSCETPLDPFLYLHCDPSDSFEVKDVMGAGRGLLAARSFQEKSFLLNYRGTIKSATGDNSDNVYTFQLKEPENVIVDASERPDCLARYITDIDCFHSSIQKIAKSRFSEKIKSGPLHFLQPLLFWKERSCGIVMGAKTLHGERKASGRKFAGWRLKRPKMTRGRRGGKMNF